MQDGTGSECGGGPSGPGGPQLRPAKARCLRLHLRPLVRSLRKPRPECGFLPVVSEFADELDRAAIGSPQPPPGGGLQFASRRSARASPPLGCGQVSGWGSVLQGRAGRSLPGAEARCSLTSHASSAGCSPS